MASDHQVAVALDRSPLPAGYAHTLGCMLVELAHLAKEREAELKQTGQVLDVKTMVTEFGTRIQERMALNGSDASVTWNKSLIQ